MLMNVLIKRSILFHYRYISSYNPDDPMIISWQQFLMVRGIHISFWSLIKMSLPYQTIFKFYFLRPTLIDSRKSLDVKSVRKVYIAYLLGSSLHDVMLYINVYIWIYIITYITRTFILISMRILWFYNNKSSNSILIYWTSNFL